MKTLFLLMMLIVLLPVVTYGQSQQTMTVKVFFPNTKRDPDDCGKVYPVTRTIPKTAAVARATLEQLFAGPTSDEKAQGFYSDFSEATKSFLISVSLKNNRAYVNLKDLSATTSIGNVTTSCGSSNFFGQVDSTLKQFPSIKKVLFALDGNPSHFYDWMQIGECPKELKNCDASNFIK